MSEPRLKVYSDFAHWWPLLSPPSHYIEEAADLLPSLLGTDEAIIANDPAAVADSPIGGGSPASRPTMLELGCGGGSLAFHFKPHFTLTLTDRSPGMLAQSQRVNPECEHILGDMRTIDLGREFDRVFVHDAIMYATTPEALRATIRTAARHCRVGGMVMLVPDFVKETFEPSTDHGGEDGSDGRALRHLEWTFDPDPGDCTCETVFTLVMREADGQIAIDSERHVEGVFPRADWLAWGEEAGLSMRSRTDPWDRDVFTGIRRA